MLSRYSDRMICFVATLPASYAAISVGCLTGRILSAPEWSILSVLAMLFTSFIVVAPMAVFVVPVALIFAFLFGWPVLHYLPRLRTLTLALMGGIVGALVGLSLGYVESGNVIASQDDLVFGAGGIASGAVFALVAVRMKRGRAVDARFG